MVLLQVNLILLRAFIVESPYRTGRKRTDVGETCKMESLVHFRNYRKKIQFVLVHAKTTGIMCECLVRKLM